MNEGNQYIQGILEPLPTGEKLLWQGAPVGWSLARRLFRIHWLTAYFAMLLVSRAGWLLSSGSALKPAVLSALLLLPFALIAIGMLTGIAWLMAKTTIYAITDRRVVMRIGIALPLTINIPLRTIASAGLKTYPGGGGDIPMLLGSGDRIAYLSLWPHARPWRFGNTEPMLRSIADAAKVATILAGALTDSSQGTRSQAPDMERQVQSHRPNDDCTQMATAAA